MKFNTFVNYIKRLENEQFETSILILQLTVFKYYNFTDEKDKVGTNLSLP